MTAVPYPSDVDTSEWTVAYAWTMAHVAMGVLLDHYAHASKPAPAAIADAPVPMLRVCSTVLDLAIERAPEDDTRHLWGP